MQNKLTPAILLALSIYQQFGKYHTMTTKHVFAQPGSWMTVVEPGANHDCQCGPDGIWRVVRSTYDE